MSRDWTAHEQHLADLEIKEKYGAGLSEKTPPAPEYMPERFPNLAFLAGKVVGNYIESGRSLDFLDTVEQIVERCIHADDADEPFPCENPFEENISSWYNGEGRYMSYYCEPRDAMLTDVINAEHDSLHPLVSTPVLIIMGKSGSGKDTTGKLLEDKGYERIVTHTSRPMRTGEQNGVSYVFHTQEEFDSLRGKGYFAESRDYDAQFGHCSYGTSKESLVCSKPSYLIVTPSGYEALMASGSENLIPIYIKASDDLLRSRLEKRLENEVDDKVKATLRAEISRRLDADYRDFADVDAASAGICTGGIYDDLITINVEEGMTPDDVATAIEKQAERRTNLMRFRNDDLCLI